MAVEAERSRARGPFSPDERRIVHFTGFAHAATHYVELVYPTLAVGLALESGIALERVLSWSFGAYLMLGLGALPAGFAADRYGSRRVILVGLFASGIAGQYLGGMIADNRELRASYLAFHLASLPLLVLVSRLDQLPLLVASSLYVFFALGMQPIENSLFASLTPERWRSTAYGLKFVLTFGVGSSAVWMVRSVAASYGWTSVYAVLSGVVVLLLGCIGLLFAFTSRRPVHNRTAPIRSP
jgi:MFS family permease